MLRRRTFVSGRDAATVGVVGVCSLHASNMQIGESDADNFGLGLLCDLALASRLHHWCIQVTLFLLEIHMSSSVKLFDTAAGHGAQSAAGR